MDCTLSGSSVHGILQARILEWVAIPFSRASSQPRDRTQLFYTAGIFFTVWATREAHCYPYLCFVYWMVSLLKMEPCLILSTYQNAWPRGVWSTCDWWMNKWKWGRSGNGFYESRIDSEFAWILIQPLFFFFSYSASYLWHLFREQETCHSSGERGDRLHDFPLSCIYGKFRKTSCSSYEKQQLSQNRAGC